MMTAITIMKTDHAISPLFESAARLYLVRSCRGKLAPGREIELPEDEERKIGILLANGVKLLICGAIANDLRERLERDHIRVVPFVSGDWREVLKTCLVADETGAVQFVMPGCGTHHRRCCRGRRGRFGKDFS